MDTPANDERLAEDLMQAFESAVLRGDAPDPEGFLEDHTSLRYLLEPKVEALMRLNRDLAEASNLGVPRPGEERAPQIDPITDDDYRELLEKLAALSRPSGTLTLGHEITRGGMGRILEAFDEVLGRRVAVKVIRGAEAGSATDGSPASNLVRRFLSEARITARLEHPGVVPVHEMGVDSEGLVYFTMRHIEGEDYSRVIEQVHSLQAGWTLTKAIRVLVRVCEAVAYAHAKWHVIHRDLKPSNVRVGQFGETYVMDWGLAKVIGADEPSVSRFSSEGDALGSALDSLLHTLEGEAIGTAPYMSPEQAWGRVAEVTKLSDVYSAGAILYHLLTGSVPYVSPGEEPNSLVVRERVKNGPPASVRALRPDAPRELAAICERAMARNPRDRYATMMVLADDLNAYLDGRVVGAYESGIFPRIRKLVHRNKAISATLAVAVLFALASILALVYVRLQARLSYVSHILAAEASLAADEPAEARRSLQLCDEGLRNWEWRHLDITCDTSVAVLRDHAGPVRHLATSADGAVLASSSEDKTIRVWDVASRIQRAVLPMQEAAAECLAISPDGDVVAFVAGKASLLGSQGAGGPDERLLLVWNVASAEQPRVLFEGSRGIQSIDFSPDGRSIAVSEVDDLVRILEVRTGEAMQVIPAFLRGAGPIAFSPDGSRLLTGSGEGWLDVWDVATGSRLRRCAGHSSGIPSCEFSPDGRRILAGSNLGGTVQIFDSVTGVETLLIRSADPGWVSASWIPDGTAIAVTSDSQAVRIVDAGTGHARAVLRGHEGRVNVAVFLPGGELLATASEDGTIRLWDAETNQAFDVLRGPAEPVVSLAFSPPDGRYLAAGGLDDAIHLWEASSGEAVAVLAARDGDAACVAFFPGGSSLVSGYESGRLRVWEVASATPSRELTGHPCKVSCVAVAPDGRRIASGDAGGRIKLWDATTGGELLGLDGHGEAVTGVTFFPDGLRIVTTSTDMSARIWDPNTGREIDRLKGHAKGVSALALSPDGTLLATGSEDKTIILWDTASGREVRNLRGHTAPIGSLAFSPDGTRLVSGGGDSSLRLWEVESGGSLGALAAGIGSVNVLAFSPDGSCLASSSNLHTPWLSTDNVVRVWSTVSVPERVRSRRLAERARRQAEAIVQPLFDRNLPTREIVDTLDANGSLTPELRESSKRLARIRTDDPNLFDHRSWMLAMTPGRSRSAYERAVAMASEACRLDDTQWEYHHTRGVAEYRSGLYEKARLSLARANERWRATHGGSEDKAVVLIFLSMAHAQLGHSEEAARVLERARQLVVSTEQGNDTYIRYFQREAEEVLAASRASRRGGAWGE